jgi:hypothetical protein
LSFSSLTLRLFFKAVSVAACKLMAAARLTPENRRLKTLKELKQFLALV